MILGLDVSTSCTGWCVMDPKFGFKQMGYIKLSKIPSMFAKANITQAELEKLQKEFSITRVVIEENLTGISTRLFLGKDIVDIITL